MAGQGVDKKSWYAVRFSYAGDEQCRRWLQLRLLMWARKRRLYKRWRWRAYRTGAWRMEGPRDAEGKRTWIVRPSKRSYLADLVAMHFDEERHPAVFQTGKIWPIIVYSSEETWSDVLSPIYEDIRLEYMHWRSQGRYKMREWLGDEEAA